VTRVRLFRLADLTCEPFEEVGASEVDRLWGVKGAPTGGLPPHPCRSGRAVDNSAVEKLLPDRAGADEVRQQPEIFGFVPDASGDNGGMDAKALGQSDDSERRGP
jgi:hypothetical protein